MIARATSHPRQVVWLDENGEPEGTFDVYDCLAMCKEHYEKVALGAGLLDSPMR